MSQEKYKAWQAARQKKVDDAWALAQKLEAEDRFEEAEKTIEAAIDHIGCFSQIAYLYELRVARKSREGDQAAANDAAERAAKWLRFYASCATSGGEGAALSLERDQRLAALNMLDVPDTPPRQSPEAPS